MRSVLRGALVLIISVGGLVASQGGTASAAANPIQFARIQYDSPGKDTGTNASLNAEWFQLKNTGHSTVNLKSWTVRDAQNHVYKFASNFSLAPGHVVTVHTGSGTNTSTNRYWGSHWYIWNNGGDHAYVRTPSGSLADSCAWTSVGAGYKNC